MNMMKKNGGFTLVELIVVIAILAILAGVAVPAYSGYIKKAQDAAVITELDAIQTAAQAANATAGEISKIEVGTDGKTLKVTCKATASESFKADFEMFYDGSTATVTAATDSAPATVKIVLTNAINNFENSSYAKGATWNAVAATGVEAGWTAATSDVSIS